MLADWTLPRAEGEEERGRRHGIPDGGQEHESVPDSHVSRREVRHKHSWIMHEPEFYYIIILSSNILVSFPVLRSWVTQQKRTYMERSTCSFHSLSSSSV